MRLLICITTQAEKIDAIFHDMLSQGLRGATTIDGNGMLQSINESDFDPPPIFGSLRQFLHPDKEHIKIILMVLTQENLPKAKAILYDHLGDFAEPDTGILFELPVENVEGLIKRK